MTSFQKIGFKIFLKALLASLALISGGIIYILIRPSEVIFTRIIKHSAYTLKLQEFGSNIQWQSSELPEWILYSLPDGLWAFAYALLITSLWSLDNSSVKKYWMLSIPSLTLGFEILQLIGLMPGTFCLMDMYFLITGISAGYLIGRINLKNLNNENEPKKHSKYNSTGGFYIFRHSFYRFFNSR